MSALAHRLSVLDTRMQHWLAARSLVLLRVSVGLVFLGFGALKLVPGVSPAEDLVIATADRLFLGVVPGGLALAAVALVECLIGLSLITGRALRLGVLLLIAQLVGILSPLVLLPERLFSGPGGAPTLEGQYVLKDVILAAAAFVLFVAASGGRLVGERRTHARAAGGDAEVHSLVTGYVPAGVDHVLVETADGTSRRASVVGDVYSARVCRPRNVAFVGADGERSTLRLAGSTS